MAILVNRRGKLRLIDSTSVLTGRQRIAQIARMRERVPDDGSDGFGGGGGDGGIVNRVTIANCHLSFPGGPDPVANARRQAMEVQIAARALDRIAAAPINTGGGGGVIAPHGGGGHGHCRHRHLQIIGGDFNSNSLGLAASKLESSSKQFGGYVNSATATANLIMAGGSVGGRINLGVTHRTHRGEDVSVDHIFARTVRDDYDGDEEGHHRCIDGGGSKAEKATAAAATSPAPPTPLPLRGLGYLDDAGTRISYCNKRGLDLRGDAILSDHRPVTARFEWPPPCVEGGGRFSGLPFGEAGICGTLANGARGGWAAAEPVAMDPLQSPWDTP